MRVWISSACVALAACGAGDASTDQAPEGAVAGTTSGDTRNFAARNFTGVEVAGPDDVEVRTGGRFGVVATGEPELLDQLVVIRTGETLRIERKSRDSWSWGDRGAARIVVTMPAIRSSTLSGSGDLTVDRAQGDFDGGIAGSGNLTVGALEGGTARLRIAGSGTIAVAGQVATLVGEIAGTGSIDARQLKASGATVRVAGPGDIRADVSGLADVAIMGPGKADLGPNARCTRKGVGPGEVTCGQLL